MTMTSSTHVFRFVFFLGALLVTFLNLLTQKNAYVVNTQSHDEPSSQGRRLVRVIGKQWENDLNVVHVIHTRFMQHQPHLKNLGRARLELFKSFCIPTIRAQTNQQFLWILRVDPDLPTDLKEDFLSLIDGMNNTIVAGSNARVDDGYLRNPSSTEDINEDSLWYGSLDLLHDYQRASQDRVLLETGLDADDGLATYFVDDYQKEAVKVAQSMTNSSSEPWFRILCIKSTMEWQYYGKYEMSKMGSLRTYAFPAEICLTPGLTRVSSPEFKSYKQSPQMYNAKDRDFSGIPKDGYRFFVDHFYLTKNLPPCSEFHPAACWSYFERPGTSSVIRARTPTSASMSAVKIPRGISDRERSKGEKAQWSRILNRFGLDLDTIVASRTAFDGILYLVLQDAVSGLCTVGHSCMAETKERLLRIQNITSINKMAKVE